MGAVHSFMGPLEYWLGCDPGGVKSFGLTKLYLNGTYEAQTLSSVDDVMGCLEDQPLGVGIDCPLWWSTGKGGGRKADEWIRSQYKLSGGEVQSVNSLRGAVVVQGIILAMELRKRFPGIAITECHPKPLLKIFGILNIEKPSRNERLNAKFNLSGKYGNEHERDSIVSAVAAREGFSGHWKRDLSQTRFHSEIDPKKMWFGPVNYWWPEIGDLP